MPGSRSASARHRRHGLRPASRRAVAHRRRRVPAPQGRGADRAAGRHQLEGTGSAPRCAPRAGLLGLLVVQSYTTEHTYTQADLDLLAFVGQHVASALTRARAIEETRQRNAELGRHQRDRRRPRQAARLRVDHRARRRADSDASSTRARCSSRLYDESTGMITFPYEIEDGRRIRSEPLAFGPGLTSHVIRTGGRCGWARCRNRWRSARSSARRSPGRRSPPPGNRPGCAGCQRRSRGESWLGVPILTGDGSSA